ncbi:MAG: hypothetical protein AB7N91_17260 [Candidatus Tectimicrobiota bacterium]
MDFLFSPDGLRLVLKAAFGAVLFTLILWCAQSRHPRAAGMMLTFPAVNGIGLLTAEREGVFIMVQAMPPMIILNGLLCAAYILVQRRLTRRTAGIPPLAVRLGVLFLCLCLWLSVALLVAPRLHPYLASAASMLALVGGYAISSIPVTTSMLWCPAVARGPGRLSFSQVLRTHALRISAVFGLIMLIMLVARYASEAWAGRLSTLPVLPFYSLLVLSSRPAPVPTAPSPLDQVGSTVLAGPLIAILFAWAYAHYLYAVRVTAPALLDTLLAVSGLLLLWGLCGLSIWGLLRWAQRLDSPPRPRALSQEPG